MILLVVTEQSFVNSWNEHSITRMVIPCLEWLFHTWNILFINTKNRHSFCRTKVPQSTVGALSIERMFHLSKQVFSMDFQNFVVKQKSWKFHFLKNHCWNEMSRYECLIPTVNFQHARQHKIDGYFNQI